MLQVLLNRMVHGLNLATSVLSPRIHSQPGPIGQIEQGISPDTIDLLEQWGHTIQRSRAMGSANSVEVQPRRQLGVAILAGGGQRSPAAWLACESAGRVFTSAGNRMISTSTATCTAMKGQTPR